MSKARELAELGAVYDSGALSNRNLVINGGMQVAQRATSVTGIGTNAGAYHTLDRWKLYANNTAGRLTMSQASDGPSGFANCLKFDCTTADTSIAADEALILITRFEGQDLQKFAKGTSDAKPFAVSFYVKGDANATYVCELRDEDNTRIISKLFSVTTAWTRVEIIFPADTTGAFTDDNNLSLSMNIFLHAGSNYTSGTLNSSSWAANNNANRAVGISSFFDSTNREFYLTGVQLEVGDTATPFEHRSFDDELRRCYRYYQQLKNTLGTHYLGINQAYSTGAVFGMVRDYIVPMRTVPTVGQDGNFSFSQADSAAINTGAIQNLAANDAGWYCGGWSGGSGLVYGGASVLYWAVNAKLTADAEL
tara:strand:- start:193 stop:1287 length:1095 start_codon:yes stop_codon:yes gene_type:complete